MNTASSLRTIAFLGDYLPRKCGIATFTSDLLGAVAARHPRIRCFATPVNDIEGCYRYPEAVRFEIEEQNLESYRGAADFLNDSEVDVVSVQHEFGIYGGAAGSHLLALLNALRAPVVSTLHTVLLRPNGDQLRVMRELIAPLGAGGGDDRAGTDDPAGRVPGAPGENRRHPAWHSRRDVCRPGILQGPVRS